jgi:hypothetical protein
MKTKPKPLTRKRAIAATIEDELVALTRDVERLRREKRKWARKLRAADKELKATRREQRALLAQIKTERAPDILPSKLTAGATGYRRPADRGRHLASCLYEGGRWFCAADCPQHVIVDVDAERAAAALVEGL